MSLNGGTKKEWAVIFPGRAQTEGRPTANSAWSAARDMAYRFLKADWDDEDRAKAEQDRLGRNGCI